jgi:outer membrane protein assembly factor BamE (lipoprotein component of BamABCDE complex)
MAKALWVPPASLLDPRLLQTRALPGTSRPSLMQGDGTRSGMIKSSLNNSTRSFGWRGMRTMAAVALLCAVVSGCGEQFQKGYVLPPGALEQIPIGASQDQVLIVMGTPSTVATLNGEVFYYISQRTERTIAFMNDKVVDQRIIAIYFDKNRQVRRLANYGLKDGKIFDFVTRTTPTSGQEINYVAPLFKAFNIGQGN